MGALFSLLLLAVFGWLALAVIFGVGYHLIWCKVCDPRKQYERQLARAEREWAEKTRRMQRRVPR